MRKKANVVLFAALLFVCLTLSLFVVNHYVLHETSTLMQSVASGAIASCFVLVFTQVTRKWG